jgi:hypothetical protein
MAKKTLSTFDSKVFLATIDGGRTISNYSKGAIIFSQVTTLVRPGWPPCKFNGRLNLKVAHFRGEGSLKQPFPSPLQVAMSF